MASLRVGTPPVNHVLLATPQNNVSAKQVVVRVLGYINMFLEIYLALYLLSCLVDVGDKYNEKHATMSIMVKSDVAFYIVTMTTCIVSIGFGIILITGTVLDQHSCLKAHIFYIISHIPIVLVLIYYANYELSNFLQNRVKTLVFLIFTKVPGLAVLPLTYVCYQGMSKQRPRVIIPLQGYGPEWVPRVTSVRIPIVNPIANNDVRTSDEAFPKPEPPPSYELTEDQRTYVTDVRT